MRGMGDHRLGRGGVIVADIVDAARMGAQHRGLQRGGDIFDMDAGEDLTGLHDAAGGAIAHLGEGAAAGAIDAREAEDVERQTQCLPLRLGQHALFAPGGRGGEGGLLIHPGPRVIAINPGGGEIAHPEGPRGGDFGGMGVQHRVALRPRRDGGKDMRGLGQRGRQ